MEQNLVTQKLLAAGWTKDQTPPGMEPWNEFYGGWEYDRETLASMTFETPCGLLEKGSRFLGGHMSYGGVDWTAENDCPTITCPHFPAQPCPLRHPVLARDNTENRGGVLQSCACHRVDKPYTYQGSVEQVLQQREAEADELWRHFDRQHGGRVCRNHAHFNRTTKTWSIRYDPMLCVQYGHCQYCPILGKPLDSKKGNVFYDVRSSWVEPAHGLFPAEPNQAVEKGKKLLDKPVSLTICQAIVDYGLHQVKASLETNWSWKQFRDPSLRMEAVNFRAVGKDTRDLLQDLQDVAQGIAVSHAADSLKAAKEQKKARIEAAKAAKARRLEKLIRQNGWENLEPWQKRQAEKLLGSDGIDQAIEQRQTEQNQPRQVIWF